MACSEQQFLASLLFCLFLLPSWVTTWQMHWTVAKMDVEKAEALRAKQQALHDVAAAAVANEQCSEKLASVSNMAVEAQAAEQLAAETKQRVADLAERDKHERLMAERRAAEAEQRAAEAAAAGMRAQGEKSWAWRITLGVILVAMVVGLTASFLPQRQRMQRFMWEWALVEKVRRVPYLVYYDLCLRYDEFMDLSDPATDPPGAPGKGWSVSIKPEADWHGVAVAVFGDFNRGKTWLLGRLAGIQGVLPCGNLHNTPALCVKSVRMDDRAVLIIDTAGRNTPVRPVTEDGLKTKKIEEAFMRDLSFNLADVIIFVVNQVTSKEQVELHQVSEYQAREARYGRDRHRALIIVHNLQHVCWEQERVEAIERLRETYGISDAPKKGQDNALHWETLNGVRYVNGKDAFGTQTMHFLLFNDQVFREDNDRTLEVMKVKIHGVAGAERARDFYEELRRNVKELLGPYFRGQSGYEFSDDWRGPEPCWENPEADERQRKRIGDVWRCSAHMKRKATNAAGIASPTAPPLPRKKYLDKDDPDDEVHSSLSSGDEAQGAPAAGGARALDDEGAPERAPLRPKAIFIGSGSWPGSADNHIDICETKEHLAIYIDFPGVACKPDVKVEKVDRKPMATRVYYVVSAKAYVPEPKLRQEWIAAGGDPDECAPASTCKSYGEARVECRFEGEFDNPFEPAQSFEHGVLTLLWKKQQCPSA